MIPHGTLVCQGTLVVNHWIIAKVWVLSDAHSHTELWLTVHDKQQVWLWNILKWHTADVKIINLGNDSCHLKSSREKNITVGKHTSAWGRAQYKYNLKLMLSSRHDEQASGEMGGGWGNHKHVWHASFCQGPPASPSASLTSISSHLLPPSSPLLHLPVKIRNARTHCHSSAPISIHTSDMDQYGQLQQCHQVTCKVRIWKGLLSWTRLLPNGFYKSLYGYMFFKLIYSNRTLCTHSTIKLTRHYSGLIKCETHIGYHSRLNVGIGDESAFICSLFFVISLDWSYNQSLINKTALPYTCSYNAKLTK